MLNPQFEPRASLTRTIVNPKSVIGFEYQRKPDNPEPTPQPRASMKGATAANSVRVEVQRRRPGWRN